MKLGVRLFLLRTSLPFAWKWFRGGGRQTPMEFWRWWRLSYNLAAMGYEHGMKDEREA